VTDKVNAEVPSPFEGTLREILVEEGATVPNNAEIAVIETADDGAGDGASAASGAVTTAEPKPAEAEDKPKPAEAAEKPAPSEPSPAAAPSAEPTPAVATGPAGSDERSPSETAAAATAGAPTATARSAPPATGDGDARMTPAVRRLLREHDLTPAQIVGTGGGGRITRDDVLKVVEAMRTGTAIPAASAAGGNGSAAPSAPAPAAPTAGVPAPAPAGGPVAARTATPTPASIEFPGGADEVLVPTTQMRKGIAAQMTRALQAPHAYVQMEVDVTRLTALREKTKSAYQAKEGLGLSYVPFVVKAVAESLKRNPTFNAHWTDEGLMAKRRVNIGVAVAVDEGLIVPVIRDADQLSIHGLNVAISDVANRARAGKFKVDDFGGGTFTVDNTGYLGTNLVMPILNVPEVGIVTMEAITRRPVVVSTPEGDVIAIRPIMNMVLGVDHRANDGAGGAALLRDIKHWLESVGPETPIY
jgi:pyruvate/2-oxoglutarate dehydrogenase complex dihydrolipoamide acyltransferase (E2) component